MDKAPKRTILKDSAIPEAETPPQHESSRLGQALEEIIFILSNIDVGFGLGLGLWSGIELGPGLGLPSGFGLGLGLGLRSGFGFGLGLGLGLG